MIRIAVDAMGGDRAPDDIVAGAVGAARKAKDQYEIVLVGDSASVEEALHRHHFIKYLPISIVHASQKVEMDESPAQAIKQKPDSSISVAVRLLKEGKAEAMVSAGNTGAVLAASLFILRPIEGIIRPAVGAFIPCGHRNFTFLIDAGANVDCKPMHLFQFGVMGSILMNRFFQIERPRVALLNIGEEPTKGNEVVLEAYGLLEKSNLHFIGNVEGRDIMRNKADVIVCDGFVGNVLIKFAGGLSHVLSSTLKRKIGSNIAGSIGHFLMKHKFKKLTKLFDYQEYGGAPLLGVNGNVIISHGISSPYAIQNAIEEAYRVTLAHIPDHIKTQLKQMKGNTE